MPNPVSAPHRTVLRPEPHWLSWEKLDSSQREAFGKIVLALNDALSGLPKDHNSECDSSVPRQSQQLMWLHGKRGMGKTTLLKSVKYALTQSERWNASIQSRSAGELRDDSAKKPSNSVARSFVRYSEVDDVVTNLQGRLIWLDSLEMDFLPGSTNLLASILARVQRAVDQHSKSFTETPRGMLERRTSADDAVTELFKLMADVSLAWDGNVPARAGNVDPDTYAREVNRAERARLDVPRRYSKVLNDLALNLDKSRSGKSPLFVLPIDDCDLSPERCLEILRLTRLFQSPRLFVIVLGDFHHAEKLLRLKFTGDFAKVADIALTTDIFSHPFYVLQRPLTFEALKKLVPPNQRVFLESMSASEILRYQPYDGEKRIGEMLEEIKVPRPALAPPDSGARHTWSLLDLLSVSPFLKPLSSSAARSQRSSLLSVESDSQTPGLRLDYSYGGFSRYRISPRTVADLWGRLDRFRSSRDREDKLTFETVFELFTESVNASINLSDDELQSVQQVIQKRDNKSQLWKINPSRIQVEWSETLHESIIDSKVDQSDSSRSEFGSKRFDVWFDGKWTLRPKRQSVETSSGQTTLAGVDSPELDDAATAMLLLTHDLIQLTQSGPREPSLTQQPDQDSFCETVWGFADRESVRLAWPSPNFPTFWEWDHFISAWSEANRRLSDLRVPFMSHFEIHSECLAYWWIAVGIAMFDQHGFPEIQQDLSPNGIDPGRWQALAERVSELATDALGAQINRSTSAQQLSDYRLGLLRVWLIKLAFLLAPETGLSKAVSGYFLPPSVEPTSLKKLWLQSSTWIRTERTSRAAKFPADDAEKEKFVADLFGIRQPRTTLLNARAAATDKLREFVQLAGKAAVIFAPGRRPKPETAALTKIVDKLLTEQPGQSLFQFESNTLIDHLMNAYWRKKVPTNKVDDWDAELLEAIGQFEKLNREAADRTWHPINSIEELCPSAADLNAARATHKVRPIARSLGE